MISSKEYWDNRLAHDWEQKRGLQQTLFFATLTLDDSSEWFLEYIAKYKLSIVLFNTYWNRKQILLIYNRVSLTKKLETESKNKILLKPSASLYKGAFCIQTFKKENALKQPNTLRHVCHIVSTT